MFNKHFAAKAKRERNTPQQRAYFGVMEHKKEFKRRCNAFRKLNQYKKELMREAEQKNPDEFYIEMNDLRFDGGRLYVQNEEHEYDYIPEIKLQAAWKQLQREMERLKVEKSLGKDVTSRIAQNRLNAKKIEDEFERRRINRAVSASAEKYVDDDGREAVRMPKARRK